jgi:hypothetical protein
MKSVVYKAFWDYENEEKWLNEMAAKGLAMTDYTAYRYVFEERDPGEYVYRIDLLEHGAKHPESVKYLRFMEESGVEHVCTFRAWVYFRKKAADGPFELYSDLDSRIKHCRRLCNLWLGLGLAELCLILSQVSGIMTAIRTGGSYWVVNAVSALLLASLTALCLGLWRRYDKRIKRLRREREIQE